MPTRPTVVLSVDAELIGGFHRIPATWAVVGHRFLDSCDGIHSDHPAGKEWFSRDPGGEYAPVSGWFDNNSVMDMHHVADEVKNSD